MAYTDPPTFASGAALLAAELNVISDDIRYLYAQLQGVVFSAVAVRRAATQSIATSTETLISFDTENIDVGGWWSAGTNVVVPAGAIPSGSTSVGLLVGGLLKFASNNTGARRLRLLKNGTSFFSLSLGAESGGDVTGVVGAEVTDVVAGDVLTLEAYQTSGASLNVTEARLFVIREGVVS